jgi:hypothetical protein
MLPTTITLGLLAATPHFNDGDSSLDVLSDGDKVKATATFGLLESPLSTSARNNNSKLMEWFENSPLTFYGYARG